MIKVLFKQFLGRNPDFVKREYNEDFLDNTDAGMLIGDDGLRFLYTNKEKLGIYDLGELWTKFTGLPFVYAVLAVNVGVDLGDELDNLIQSKEEGPGYIDEICEKESVNIGIAKEFCINYVMNRIHYDLGEEEIKGIAEFAGCLRKIGIDTRFEKLDFYTK